MGIPNGIPFYINLEFYDLPLMKKLFGEHWAFVYSALVLCILMILIFEASRTGNNGHFVYSLDDAYIHMAMAKNLALYGVWGVSKYQFASCSSSILWTLLLSFFYLIFGVNEIIPIILNIIFGLLVIFSSYLILRRYKVKNIYIFFILISLIFVTPLPPLMFTGLEHVLHIWISILFVYFVSEELVLSEPNKKNLVFIVLLAFLLPLVRYEGIVLVAATSFVFLFRGRWRSAALILILSFLPVFIFGIISIDNGWSFFPNSLLLKGNFPDVTSFGGFIKFIGFLYNLYIPPEYFPLVIAGSAVLAFVLYLAFRYRKKEIFRLKTTYLLLLLTVNIVLYSVYSKSGWSYRYQSFLIALGIVIISIVFFKHVFINAGKFIFIKISLSVIFLLIPAVYFAAVGFDLMRKTPVSSTNIYEQQYQMGHFLKKYYQNRSVALNDIGACNYFADINCLDLWGLSNLEISKKRRAGILTVNDFREAAGKYNADIAILYDSWFMNGDNTMLPKEWIKVGEWKIQNNVIAGDDVVSFYSISSKEEYDLTRNLKSYSDDLPESVIQTGIYVSK
jgi:hypothetical protein